MSADTQTCKTDGLTTGDSPPLHLSLAVSHCTGVELKTMLSAPPSCDSYEDELSAAKSILTGLHTVEGSHQFTETR